MTKLEFENKVGSCDEVFSDRIINRRGLYLPPQICDMFTRYFRNGLEVAYWSNDLNTGHIFEEPRSWYGPYKENLLSIPNHHLVT